MRFFPRLREIRFNWDGLRFGLWDFNGGSNSHIFGASVICGPRGKDDEWWRDWIVRPIWNVGSALHGARLWVSYRIAPRHQYHLINTGLEPGYYDVDTLMLNGCMALLKRYVEDEMGGLDQIEAFNQELRDPAKDPNAPMELKTSQADRQESAASIYRWWTIERPKDLARDEELVHYLYGGKWGLREIDDPEEVLGVKVTRSYGRLDPLPPDAKERHEELRALEEKISTDEQRMLHALIDIRGSLWT